MYIYRRCFSVATRKKHETCEEGVEQEQGIDFDDLNKEDCSPDYEVDKDGFEIDNNNIPLEDPEPDTSPPPAIEAPPPKAKAETLTNKLNAMTISASAPKHSPVA